MDLALGLDFIQSAEHQSNCERVTRRWDKEWMRYFSSGKDYSFYFYDMDTPNYALNFTPNQIKEFSSERFFRTKLFKQTPGSIWLPGKEFVNKKVVEIGCGPGIMGRISSRYVDQYMGVDVSRFALSIAELTSPSICSYTHIFDATTLAASRNSFDLAYGRHFFIHHNYADSVWLLALMRDLTRTGGIVHADFFGNESSLDGHRRVKSTAELSEEHPSSLYYFSDSQIERIASEVGLEIEDLVYIPDAEVKFATMRVR